MGDAYLLHDVNGSFVEGGRPLGLQLRLHRVDGMQGGVGEPPSQPTRKGSYACSPRDRMAVLEWGNRVMLQVPGVSGWEGMREEGIEGDCGGRRSKVHLECCAAIICILSVRLR